MSNEQSPIEVAFARVLRAAVLELRKQWMAKPEPTFALRETSRALNSVPKLVPGDLSKLAKALADGSIGLYIGDDEETPYTPESLSNGVSVYAKVLQGNLDDQLVYLLRVEMHPLPIPEEAAQEIITQMVSAMNDAARAVLIKHDIIADEPPSYVSPSFAATKGNLH